MMRLVTEAIRHPGKIIPFLTYKFFPLIQEIHDLYMHLSKNSIYTLTEEMSKCSLLPQKLIDKIIMIYKPTSILDIGCGSGKAIDYFLKQKISEVVGVEGSQLAIEHSEHPELIIKYNLNNELNLNRKFDLIYSFEFLEHIHPKYVDNLLRTFAHHSDIVIVSAAQPGQGGLGHLNEQPMNYWINKFKEYRYHLNSDNTFLLRSCKDLFSDNLLVFER
ncbi:MAG: class I SAM-dependent methyltransferase [Candidatus Brocadiales bacterium]|nr:class I SAM-dependent methyltransferase [Candidatus Brocadiales bacterium]